MSSALLQIAGWAYLPDLLTRYTLQILHNLSSKFLHITPPAPRTPTYVQHYRYTYALVVLSYLTYTFVSASIDLPANFYQVLNVAPGTDDGALKAAFRAFAKRNHPDRVGAEGEERFMAVRDAFDALRDPGVRFAYDRWVLSFAPAPVLSLPFPSVLRSFVLITPHLRTADSGQTCSAGKNARL
ncbi:hypothetical protein HYDPIDRAFT_110159 [Hydnomerulius pinastri MD-312]|nr:hypothetical protein HYDPIDRAFT_110159 [Hydnomerulius pinastri MD-312]